MMMKRCLLLMSVMLYALANMAQSDRQYIRSGNKFYRQQNYVKAEAEYRKSLSVNGENPQALYNLGCALMMQQKDSAAVVQYQKAGKLETSLLRKAKIFHNIGVVCQNHKMYGDAIEAYKESLRNNPADNETRYNLALCKKLNKNKPQQNNKNKQDKNDKKKQNDKNDKNKENQKQDKDKQKQNQQNQMSKDNAEQLLNAAMQNEKATQQRVKDAMRQNQSRKLQKNW